MKKRAQRKRPYSPPSTAARYVVTLKMHDFGATNITALFEELIADGDLLGILCTPSYRHILKGVTGYTYMEEPMDLSYLNLYPYERELIYMVGAIGDGVAVNEIATKKEITYRRRKGLRYQAAKFILLTKQGETISLQLISTQPFRGGLK